MSGLFVANRVAIREYDRKYKMGTLLKHLEKQSGGHGNGIVLVHNGHAVELLKGVNVTTEEIERILQKESYDCAIFHTCTAGAGELKDQYCHPFIYGTDVFAMDGSAGVLSRTAYSVGITETEIIFDLIKGRDLDYVLDVLGSMNAVFAGVADGGHPYVIKNNGDLAEWTEAQKKDGFFFASSFPSAVSLVDKLFPGFMFA